MPQRRCGRCLPQQRQRAHERRLAPVMRNPFPAVLPLTRRFARHPNSEHEQALVRLAIELLIGLGVVFYTPLEKSSLRLLLTLTGFLLVGVLMLAHTAWRPQPMVARRVAAILNDVGGVTCAMLYAGELGVPIYLLYLWITFGNGFRFGKVYLYVSLVLSMAGFMAVLLRVDYWQDHRALGAGLWIGMVLVGLYFSTLVARLTAALQREEAANQAKRSFISSVSHELRTPLNAIIGMANLLNSTRLNREQGEMVRSLDNASHLMLALIEDVLDFSKIEAGKLLVEHIDFDLHQLVNSTLDIFRYQAGARGLALSVHLDPAAPFALRGDPHHLRQVLVNLMSNAIKFTERGHIALRIACVSNAGAFVLLRFEVEDSGIGIAPTLQHKVFDSFTQADESTSRRYGGTGLGTTISRQLVELMGGQLGLRSEVGVGSTFWFELDLQVLPNPVLQLPASLRILLVGFATEALDALTTELDNLGISWLASVDSNTARAALATAPATGARFTLVMLGAVTERSADDVVPALRQAVHALQQAVDDPSLPVVLCDRSDASCSARQTLAQQAGLANVLQLPLRRAELIQALHFLVLRRTDDPSPVNAEVAYNGTAPLPAADPVATQRRRVPYRILVAEDNPTNRIVIRKMLERAGHYCSLVEDGEAALDQIDQEDFDAVIVDMNMPVMNGLDATRALRVLMLGRHLPIIMLSADVTAETQAECLAAGIDCFLPKPIQIEKLLDALDTLISRHGIAPPRPTAQRIPSVTPIMLQPLDGEVVLNFATLAELDALGQDRRFVDGVVAGFITDNQQLMARLLHALQNQELAEVRDLLHAIKGSAMSIGAMSVRTHCALMEGLTDAELRHDPMRVVVALRDAFGQLLVALQGFQQQRGQKSTLHQV